MALCLPTAFAAHRLQCDFTFGIPSDWILIDNDGNTPSNSAAKYGFEVGIPWVCTNDGGNNVAASTSWYSPAGTSDDWMILSPVEISEQTLLSWSARAVDSRYRDGYAVYASAQGATIADFLANEPIFSVTEEEAEWTDHELSLSQYAGQEVWVAFVNNSTNKSRLFVDNISIMAPRDLAIELATDVVVTPGDPITIKGTVLSETGFTGQVLMKASWTSEETEAVEQSLMMTIDENGSAEFVFPEAIVIPAPADIELTVTADTADGLAAAEALTVRARTHYHVAEEFTGTWCGYCVRGIVALEHMLETYTEDYIGIAVHSGDVMALDNYKPETICYFSGYPYAIVDRTYGCDPRDIETKYLYAVENDNATIGAIDVEAAYDNDTHIVSADTRAWFNISDPNTEYRLAYVLKENDVYHPENPSYWQHNSYAGGGSGEMGGFENLGEYVQDIHFNEVARYISDNSLGISGSLPAIEAYKEYSHSYSFEIPEIVDDPANCTLVVMLLGNAGKTILNAVPITLESLGAISSIDSVTIDGGVTDVIYYDLQGRKVSNPKGLVIELSIHADGSVTSRKLIK